MVLEKISREFVMGATQNDILRYLLTGRLLDPAANGLDFRHDGWMPLFARVRHAMCFKKFGKLRCFDGYDPLGSSFESMLIGAAIYSCGRRHERHVPYFFPAVQAFNESNSASL